MTIPNECVNIIQRINQSGGVAHLVGGCVRDILSEKEPKDWDIVTSLKPDTLLEIFPKAKAIGKSFGVIQVGNYEIATYRTDKYRGKELKVDFVDTLGEDLARRDFTINAMALNITTNEIIDPYNGQLDLRNGVIRFVGNPTERITEDPCRMLRACRFAGEVGIIEYTTLKAIRDNRLNIQWVAKERIRIELLKMMAMERSNMCIKYMVTTYLLPYVILPLQDCRGVVQNKYHAHDVYIHTMMALNSITSHNTLLKLAVLLHDIGKPVTKQKIDGEYHFYDHEQVGAIMTRELLTGLKFSTDEITYVCGLIANHMLELNLEMKDSTIRRYMSKLPVLMEDLIKLRVADKKGNRAKVIDEDWEWLMLDRVQKINDENNALSIKDLVIGGHDLIELGVHPSPFMGTLLQDCLTVVLEDPTKNTKIHLIEYVKNRLGENT